MALQMDYNFNDYRPNDKILKVFPFNSTKKKMTTIWKKSNKKYNVYVKGAIDFMLDDCTHYIGNDGHDFAVDEEYK